MLTTYFFLVPLLRCGYLYSTMHLHGVMLNYTHLYLFFYYSAPLNMVPVLALLEPQVSAMYACIIYKFFKFL
jgi:hypothetical protein